MLHSDAQQIAVQCSALQRSAVQSEVKFSAAKFSVVLNSSLQYSAVQCRVNCNGLWDRFPMARNSVRSVPVKNNAKL